jgi:hypothetical protein
VEDTAPAHQRHTATMGSKYVHGKQSLSYDDSQHSSTNVHNCTNRLPSWNINPIATSTAPLDPRESLRVGLLGDCDSDWGDTIAWLPASTRLFMTLMCRHRGLANLLNVASRVILLLDDNVSSRLVFEQPFGPAFRYVHTVSCSRMMPVTYS